MATKNRGNAKASISIIAVLLIALVLVKLFKGCGKSPILAVTTSTTSATRSNRSTKGNASYSNYSNAKINPNEKDFRHNKIYYSKHARCRMACRQIDESEVQEILADGKINYSKSDLKNNPCPKYAVEGVTHDHQHVRIIVGDCKSDASIITVIDLGTEWQCKCPGDEKE